MSETEKFCTNCDEFIIVFPWEHHCIYCGSYLKDEPDDEGDADEENTDNE